MTAVLSSGYRNPFDNLTYFSNLYEDDKYEHYHGFYELACKTKRKICITNVKL